MSVAAVEVDVGTEVGKIVTCEVTDNLFMMLGKNDPI